MNIISIIPARLAASRFPNKPLAKIGNIPMVGHCFYRSRLINGVNKTYVATCDAEIFNYIKVYLMLQFSHRLIIDELPLELQKRSI